MSLRANQPSPNAPSIHWANCISGIFPDHERRTGTGERHGPEGEEDRAGLPECRAIQDSHLLDLDLHDRGSVGFPGEIHAVAPKEDLLLRLRGQLRSRASPRGSSAAEAGTGSHPSTL